MAKREYAVETEMMNDLDPRIQTPLGGWKIYNGSDDWKQVQVGGVFFDIPPDKGSTPESPVYLDHPSKDVTHGEPVQVLADGVLMVEDQIGRVYAGKPPRPTGQFHTVPGMAAREIVQTILRNAGAGGLALLKGTNQDERIKANARKLFADSQVERDKADILAYEANVASWKRIHPEQITPPPPEMIRLARERLDEREADKRGTFLYNCVCGTYATNNFDQYSRHARVNHNRIAKESDASLQFEDAKAVVPPVIEEPKRRGPGRPPKSTEAQWTTAATEG